MIRSSLDLVEHRVKTSQVDVQCEFNEGVTVQLIAQALLNATQGMQGAGKLLIRPKITDDTAAIDMIDNGPGIAAAIRERSFAPLFTTKARGEGLGLPIGLQSINEAGGELQLKDSTTQTRFRVSLPLALAE